MVDQSTKYGGTAVSILVVSLYGWVGQVTEGGWKNNITKGENLIFIQYSPAIFWQLCIFLNQERLFSLTRYYDTINFNLVTRKLYGTAVLHGKEDCLPIPFLLRYVKSPLKKPGFLPDFMLATRLQKPDFWFMVT